MSRLRHERRRDDQSWIFDWVVQQTGSVQNWDRPESRGLPRAVRNYAMIPKHVGREGMHSEAVARAAEAAGHKATAVAAYQQAIGSYHTAQHSIYEDDNPEKIKWYGRLAGCFEQVMKLSRNPIERVEVPWEGNELQAIFAPASKEKAPCVVLVPGMDDVKERQFFPFASLCRERGLHLLAMDGPGQGVSNIRKIRITADNSERAINAMIDYAASRPEVDADKILLTGLGTGSMWVARAVALTDRLCAAAIGPSTVFGDLTATLEQVSPRYKRVFMYMAGIHDEDQFDREIGEVVTTRGIGKEITCPTLLVQGEYDPMSPLEDGLELFEEIAGPKEFWVIEDGVHGGAITLTNMGNLRATPFMIDWLVDVMEGRTGQKGHKRLKWIAPEDGTGPYGDD